MWHAGVHYYFCITTLVLASPKFILINFLYPYEKKIRAGLAFLYLNACLVYQNPQYNEDLEL